MYKPTAKNVLFESCLKNRVYQALPKPFMNGVNKVVFFPGEIFSVTLQSSICQNEIYWNPRGQFIRRFHEKCRHESDE